MISLLLVPTRYRDSAANSAFTCTVHQRLGEDLLVTADLCIPLLLLLFPMKCRAGLSPAGTAGTWREHWGEPICDHFHRQSVCLLHRERKAAKVHVDHFQKQRKLVSVSIWGRGLCGDRWLTWRHYWRFPEQRTRQRKKMKPLSLNLGNLQHEYKYWTSGYLSRKGKGCHRFGSLPDAEPEQSMPAVQRGILSWFENI